MTAVKAKKLFAVENFSKPSCTEGLMKTKTEALVFPVLTRFLFVLRLDALRLDVLRLVALRVVALWGVALLLIALWGALSPALAVPAQGHQIMVSGPSPDSILIARNVHAKGGNVVDVSIAVALGLAVTHPYYAAFGGGGFALVKVGAQVEALDFRETAPKATHPNFYANLPEKASTDGGSSVGVPGVVAGLSDLHKRHGKLPWSVLFEDAIRLAEKGFLVSGEWVSLTIQNKDRFNEAGRKIFLKADGSPLKPGERFKQAKLARLLRQIAKKGEKAFYEGAVSRDIAKAVQASGGPLSVDDLASYRTRWLEPLKTEFRGYQIHLMPPPSSGGTVIAQALKLMQKTQRNSRAPLSVEELHWLIEIQKLAYRGRSILGDPDFVENPIADLTSDAYLDPLAKLIKNDAVIDVQKLGSPKFKMPNSSVPVDHKNIQQIESQETTHFSVMDSQGRAVALTVTLNGQFGSGVVSPEFGVVLNNEMDDFTTHPEKPNMFGLIQGAANSVRAGARPLSSMSPTIIEKDGRTVMALGAPGGPRIISAVLQIIYRLLTQDFDVDQAVQAPRVHHQFLPDVVITDSLKLPPETIASLQAKGHKVDFGRTAKVYVIRLNNDGILEAAADARGEGAAGGL
jgi:gamma-glutamyltranspeptidase/glutathione hydrolase